MVFDRVGKVYGDGTRAVLDLSLEVGDGEFIVLVGPSGCGKTTALMMAAGLEEITEGEIRIDGRVINDLEPRDRDIAMVFQNYALYPHMSVYENLAFGLQMKKTPKPEIDRRVRELAAVLGLQHLLKRKPRQLSGGQRQRVAMGRAIVRNPSAFLMDEPLSNLDAKLRVQMRAEISRIQRELGATTIYVTHDQVEAMTMGDRVAVMRKGRLQQLDAPQRLYDLPVNLFVASFIGSPEMNLVQGRLEPADGGLVCRIGEQLLLNGLGLLPPWVGHCSCRQTLRHQRDVLGDVRPWYQSRADESAHTLADIGVLAGRVDGVNLKLMKTGGIREMRRMIHAARAHGMKIMLGSMVESSLALSAAAQLAPLADYLDLDGHWLLKDDPFDGAPRERGEIRLGTRPGLGVVPAGAPVR